MGCRLAFIFGRHAWLMKLIDRLSRFGWSTMHVGPMFSISSIGADILVFEHEMQVIEEFLARQERAIGEPAVA